MAAQTSVPSVGAFSHLARAAGVAPKADDEDPNKAKATARAEDSEDGDEKKDDDTAKSKKAKAEDSDDEEKDDDETSSKKAKGKKAKAEDDEEEGDDDSDREDDDEPKARAARGRERGRIKAIVESEAGLANPNAAYQFAMGTSMSRRQAVNMLKAMGPAQQPSAQRDNLRDRMASTKQPDVGPDDGNAPEAGTPQATAAAIIAAGKKARGEA